MGFLKNALFVCSLSSLIGCSSLNCGPQSPGTGYALTGTNTVVVGISLGKDGIPQESYKDVVLHPGQKVLYAGPDEFSIVFKNNKTPNSKVENPSRGGVVVIEIPKDIFERKEFLKEFRETNQLVFDYGIRANGKELDPPMIIRPH